MNVFRVLGKTTVMAGLLFAGGFAAGSVPAGTATTTTAAPKAASVKIPAAKSSDTLVVTARLTEIPGKFAANDLYDYVYVMKYRVLSVVKGTCEGKEILVGHYNPLISRKLIKDKMNALVDGTVERFAVGAKHRLILIEPIERVWDGAIEDEYIDTELKKYFALKADIAQ